MQESKRGSTTGTSKRWQWMYCTYIYIHIPVDYNEFTVSTVQLPMIIEALETTRVRWCVCVCVCGVVWCVCCRWTKSVRMSYEVSPLRYFEVFLMVHDGTFGVIDALMRESKAVIGAHFTVFV
jgi:hypothetical protein